MCGDEGAMSAFPEFRKALGEPKGAARAILRGGKLALVREFASGTQALFVPHPVNRTAPGVGCVRWADHTVSGMCP